MTTMIGWLGATLVVVTYAQKDIRRLRYVGLLASATMLTYSVALRIWPNVALESLLSLVNLRRAWQLRAEWRAAPNTTGARPRDPVAR